MMWPWSTIRELRMKLAETTHAYRQALLDAQAEVYSLKHRVERLTELIKQLQEKKNADN